MRFNRTLQTLVRPGTFYIYESVAETPAIAKGRQRPSAKMKLSELLTSSNTAKETRKLHDHVSTAEQMSPTGAEIHVLLVSEKLWEISCSVGEEEGWLVPLFVCRLPCLLGCRLLFLSRNFDLSFVF